ncbi:hypothetical protein O7626_40775 [Micromonospora sp. WMMD1102]|uniref:hypothetical protein n=1 Tax=Micromonospora sp. WMMD1102 TaxID=3016105 RepID=UPI00241567FD|nr:hypothetical protein [Micromonospora sp. WMMD1102]MDG4790385.1 hypothetical protein [Micromonospora sp. WMMD1102]MDG4792139.1 hypothetical protein [Micromonospora sp. WMMD1102]
MDDQGAQDGLFALLDQVAADAARAEPEDDSLSPSEKFWRYHEANPAIYSLLVAFAREWRDRTGRPKLGINSLIERVRWEVAVRTNDPDFKINNNYGPWFSRLIMRQEPDLDDLFHTRRSVADDDSWMEQAA